MNTKRKGFWLEGSNGQFYGPETPGGDVRIRSPRIQMASPPLGGAPAMAQRTQRTKIPEGTAVLAKVDSLGDVSRCDLDRERFEMAGSADGAQAAASLGSDPVGCGPEHGVRGRTGGSEVVGGDASTDRHTRYIETTRGILSYEELAPLLAERALRVDQLLSVGLLAERSLDESILLELHAGLCSDLVPEWAGRWRTIEVRVGNLRPPKASQVPSLMRDYVLDLQQRWTEAAGGLSDLTLELLAFAEGRFLTVHPFADFNGRTIRLFMLELLRRLDLPRVELAPQTEPGRLEYFAALEGADQMNWQPLMVIWKKRLAALSQTK